MPKNKKIQTWLTIEIARLGLEVRDVVNEVKLDHRFKNTTYNVWYRRIVGERSMEPVEFNVLHWGLDNAARRVKKAIHWPKTMYKINRLTII